MLINNNKSLIDRLKVHINTIVKNTKQINVPDGAAEWCSTLACQSQTVSVHFLHIRNNNNLD